MSGVLRTDAGDRWRSSLAAWAIPEPILRRATDSPYRIPASLFAAEHQSCSEASVELALQVLPEGGSVLDVGCGGGAASLALVPPAGRLVGVDTNEAMLAAYAARGVARGVATQVVHGTWPEVAHSVPSADVVVCQHVVYNVAAIEAFVVALSDAARRRVVVEVSAHHPGADLTALWREFHGLDRPSEPTWHDLVRVLGELGIRPRVLEAVRPRPAVAQPRRELVAFARRRLCLTAELDDRVDSLLPADASVPPRDVVCLCWDT